MMTTIGRNDEDEAPAPIAAMGTGEGGAGTLKSTHDDAAATMTTIEVATIVAPVLPTNGGRALGAMGVPMPATIADPVPVTTVATIATMIDLGGKNRRM